MSGPGHFPFCAVVGPDEPVATLGLALDYDPLPLSDLAMERLALALRNGLAICVCAQDQRVLERVTAALGMLADEPAGGRA